jgi:uncharacterized protein YuzE
VKRSATEVIYDPEADTAYLAIATSGDEEDTKLQVVVSDEQLPATIIVELDANGRVRALQLRNGSRSLPLELLRKLR